MIYGKPDKKSFPICRNDLDNSVKPDLLALMSHDLMKRFRAVLAHPAIKAASVSEATGIPTSTLSDMLKEGWANRTLSHLDKISSELPALEAEIKKINAADTQAAQ